MNKLLASLPLGDLHRISPQLVAISLPFRHVLYQENETIRDVYFLEGGACSLIKTMNDGAAAEIATIGHEGVIGASVYFGESVSISQAVIQQSCATGFKMSAEAFVAEMQRHGPFYNRVIRYSQALMSQIMQSTACNGLHSAEQRCCRLLLMTRDRVQCDTLKVTHDLLALLLGVRRPTVTLVISDLQKRGLIESRPRMIRILDRHRLEDACCECYDTINAIFARLLPELPAQLAIALSSQSNGLDESARALGNR